jgi:predicted transcriptional regulator
MDCVYRLGQVTVADLGDQLPDAPTPPAIRTMLSRLEEKGLLRHEQDGPRNVYRPTVPFEKVRDRAVDRLLDTFFARSPTDAVATILDRRADALSDEEYDRLARLVERARGRQP